MSKDATGSVFGGEDHSGGSTKTAEQLTQENVDLRAALQRERVEAGRVKALSQELSALKKEIAALRSRNAADFLPESLRNNVSEEVTTAAAAIARGVIDETKSESDQWRQDLEARLEQQKQDQEKLMKQQFIGRVEAAFPTFFESVAPGGDKHDAWKNYNRHNGATIKLAYDALDFDTISYHIVAFYKELGVQPQQGSASQQHQTQAPRQVQSGASSVQVGQNKTYTSAEAVALLESSQKDFHSGRISIDQYRAIENEINDAIKNGRVKDPT